LIMSVAAVYHKKLARWILWGDFRLLQADVDEIIRWFPAETEMLATTGSFVVEYTKGDAPEVTTLIRFLQMMTSSHGSLGSSALDDIHMRFAVAGCSKFRRPAVSGWMNYSGCHVMVFEQDLGEPGDRLMKEVSLRSKRFFRASGARVAVIEETLES